MLKGGKHGPAIVPGKADESLLFKMAAHRVEPVMPPKDKKDAEAAHPRGTRPAQALDRRRREGRLGRERRARRSPIELGELPPGVQPIVAVDMTADGAPRRRRPGQRRPGLRRRLGPGDRLARRPQGHHPVGPVQPRRQAAGRRELPDRHPLERPDRRPRRRRSPATATRSRRVAVAADGKTVVSGGLDKTIRVLGPADGKPLRQFDRPPPVLALAVSPDGKTLAVGGRRQRRPRPRRSADGKELVRAQGAHRRRSTTSPFLADGGRARLGLGRRHRRGSGRVPGRSPGEQAGRARSS